MEAIDITSWTPNGIGTRGHHNAGELRGHRGWTLTTVIALILIGTVALYEALERKGSSIIRNWDRLVRPGTSVPMGPRPRPSASVLAAGVASSYLGSDDKGAINPKTGGRLQRSAESGYMADGTAPTAAMRHVPLGSKVRVTNLNNDRSIVVRINDRGPFKKGRVIDLTAKGFDRIADHPGPGLIDRVRVEAMPVGTDTSWPEVRVKEVDCAGMERRGSGANR